MQEEDDTTEIWTDDITPLEIVVPATDSKAARITQVYLKFLFTWQALFRVSDVGMNVILAFIATLVTLLLIAFGLRSLQEFTEQLPRTVTTARRYLGGNVDSFMKFVSCPKCHQIYPIESCKTYLPNRTVTSGRCSYIKFRNHPQRTQRNACNTVLMKTVRTSAGTTTLYPRQMYCYKSVIESLKEMIQRPGFIERCEAWRLREIADDVLADIYDGNVWKEFLNPGGVPFLSLPYNFALTLNVDWFQPFKRTTYSSGAIYLAIQNLPRNERYTGDNIVLVGIIPGPHEPSKTMNGYLTPLVDELKQLWHGVVMQSISKTEVIVRAALICTACDIPAGRKVSGFVGHNALHGCSKCLKAFPTISFGEKPDYTGFDRTVWEPRSNESHRHHAREYKECRTAQQQKTIEREYGCRYSVLLELPYYDVVRMCVVDPMHNLLLGTAKHMLKVWKSRNVLDESHFQAIQQKVDTFVVPNDVGRIPSRIASGFAGFTADQWRNWILLYSLCSLKDLLPHRDYDCWLLFVKACHLLCRRSITLRQLDEADSILMEFCQTFEQLYGQDYCTINIHLHGHIKECIRDFGPVYAFWLFSFERLNGVLGSYHTNCHDIGLQLMRRFLANHQYGVWNWPEEYKDELVPLISQCRYNKGSLMADSLELSLHDSASSGLANPLPPVCEFAWLPHQKEALRLVTMELLGHDNFTILTLFKKCKAISICGFVIGSKNSRYTTSSHVMTIHPGHPYTPHLARIEFFAQVDLELTVGNEANVSHWIACVSYHFEHRCKVWFGYPTEVWARATSHDLFFIPIMSIRSRVAYCELEVDFGRIIGKEKVMVVSPLSDCW